MAPLVLQVQHLDAQALLLGDLAATTAQQANAAEVEEDNAACMTENQSVEAAPAPRVSKRPGLENHGRRRLNCACDAFPKQTAPVAQFDCQAVGQNLDETEQMLV